MDSKDNIVQTPWDKEVFGFDCYEIRVITEDTLASATIRPGHYTVKIDPLESSQLLHKYNFYYCDTLLEPYCKAADFKGFFEKTASVDYSVSLDQILAVSHGAFEHGRFHRDFNIRKEFADLRYDNWVIQLYESGNIFGLLYENDLAAFFGTSNNKIVLHAVREKYRGKGLAKYLWSAGLNELFNVGNGELTSSVSAANTAVVNLYSSLGFRFRKPVDVYHYFNASSNTCSNLRK
jgi:RimJ/RimL family protein N-acetyltransferase